MTVGGIRAADGGRMNPKRVVSRRLQLAAEAELPVTVAPAPASAPAERSEPEQLEQLYRRHARYVAGVAVRLLGRHGEIDDVVQDVFVEALRGVGRLREPNAIRGWLAKVTVRMCLRRLRRQRLLRTLHLGLPAADFESLAAPSATADQRALLAKVYCVLDRLPARTRVIWILRHVLAEPLPAIVELSACSQSTVQRRLREAEALLEEALRHA
jgi:RNA polymerase sigma-70 factor (ECF subfamily)